MISICKSWKEKGQILVNPKMRPRYNLAAASTKKDKNYRDAEAIWAVIPS